MKKIVADHAGFCFGVKRAIDLAESTVQGQRVSCYGPLIHNPQEVDRLAKLGIWSKDEESIQPGETVLIRTHGVGPQIYEDLQEKGCRIVDATCPYVQKAQRLAAQAVKEGFQVIILGDRSHPEVQGLSHWTGNTALVAASPEELEDMDLPGRIAVLAQTTEKEEKFDRLVEYLKKRTQELKVLNTICSATRLRQEAVQQLAPQTDLMIIIGGKDSSNTRKLWEICRKNGTESYHVEEPGELQASWFKGKDIVGISAGASTPAWIIEEVIRKMDEIKEVGSEQEISTEQPQQTQPVDEVQSPAPAVEAAAQEEPAVQEEPVVPEETAVREEPAVQDKPADLKEPAAREVSFKDLDQELYFQSFRPGDIIKGTVVKVGPDEILVDIGGKSEGIVSAAEMAYRRVDPRDVVSVGQEILVEVLKEDKEGNLILSRKRAMVDEALLKLEKAKEENLIITAPVTEVVKGGLVVDAGIRGFVPGSQVERTFVKDLNQYLHQELRLKVLELDLNNKKAVFSRKAVLEEEYQKQKEAIWSEISEGQTRKGIVRRLTSFGAFIDLGGIDGLLHVSEMGWGHVKDPSEVLKEGDEIEVYILKVDREKAKVSLTLKQLLQSPWAAAQEKYPAGTVVEGKVLRIAPFGAFIELERGLEGLAHISQLAEKRVNRVEDILSVGQKVLTKVLEVDPEKKRISLSLKDVTADAEKAQVQEYLEQAKEAEAVTIGDILKENEE